MMTNKSEFDETVKCLYDIYKENIAINEPCYHIDYTQPFDIKINTVNDYFTGADFAAACDFTIVNDENV